MRIGYPGRNLTLDLPAPPPLRPETYAPDFTRILPTFRPHDLDVMLEIKDKEASALTALAIARP